MKKKSILLCSLIALLLAAGCLSAYRIYTLYYFQTDYRPAEFSASDKTLQNPWRGWYQIYGYALSDTAPPDTQTIQKTIRRDENELVLLQINLREYAGSDLSKTALAQLDSLLRTWKASGKQLILRFLYDWNGQAKESEPKEIETVMRHMEQTAEIVNRYKDCVWLIQGIYVGNNGEMNNSAFMSQENMCELAAYLDSVIDSDIFLSVRTPAHWRAVAGTFLPLESDLAFSGRGAARIGLYNDGMLGSANDLGTYGDTPLDAAADFHAKGTREEELLFQNSLCAYVPNGGEVVVDNPYNDFSNALSDLKTMHVAYLNSGYDKAVLDKWRGSVFENDDCFYGTDGYTYIGEHLGYRYALNSCTFTFDPFSPDPGTLTLSVENTGFASCFRPLVSEFTIVNENGSVADTIAASDDARFWGGGQTASLSVTLDIRTYKTGTFRIYYRLTDTALNREIELANRETPTKYGYFLGELTVTK